MKLLEILLLKFFRRRKGAIFFHLQQVDGRVMPPFVGRSGCAFQHLQLLIQGGNDAARAEIETVAAHANGRPVDAMAIHREHAHAWLVGDFVEAN